MSPWSLLQTPSSGGMPCTSFLLVHGLSQGVRGKFSFPLREFTEESSCQWTLPHPPRPRVSTPKRDVHASIAPRKNSSLISPFICGFALHGFSYPRSTEVNWNIKWKHPRVNNSQVLNGVPFWVVGWNLALSCFIPPRMWIIPLSRVPMLHMLPNH